jgi:hypothetical protein
MSAESISDPDPAPRLRPVLVFMGRTEVAKYLGMRSAHSLSGVQLPPHDAEIGDRRGWFPATIDMWSLNRPGKGRWGARTGQTADGTPVSSH